MNGEICRRETELLDAIAAGTWPDAAGGELALHVAECAECTGLAAVAAAIDADRHDAERDAAPLPSGALWWRMQMRLERESLEAAARTARRTHGTIVAVTIAATAFVLATSSLLRGAWGWIAGAWPHLPDLTRLSVPGASLTMLAIAGAAVLLFTPVIVWLAVAEE